MINLESPPVRSQEDAVGQETGRLAVPRFSPAKLSQLRHSLLRVVCAAALFLLILVVFLPLSPSMPGPGLDTSWMMAMNEAVAQHLVFGRDIVFTFGPYASIYTELYHPATDRMMMGGCLFLGLAYGALLLLLGKNQKSYLLLLCGFLVAALVSSRDALLYSYPLVEALVVYRMTLPDRDTMSLRLTKPLESGTALLFAPLGLLPLIKVSLLPLCGIIAVLCAAMLWGGRKRALAFAAVAMPALFCVAFWGAARQPLLGLPRFFLSTLQIIAGYTEAMAYPGDSWECLLYVFASAAVLLVLVRTVPGPRGSKFFPGAAYGLFLFWAFKGGFVRHDPWHNNTAGGAILIAGFLLVFVVGEKRALLPLALAALVWGYIGHGAVLNIAHEIPVNLEATLVRAMRGVAKRWQSGALQKEYDLSIGSLGTAFPIDRFDGTTDIYSVNQSWLFASENMWAPRPVVQSYSVYTPGLAELDLEHLKHAGAPDNIIFRVEPIDGRLASLEDGLSWPAIINGYSLTKLDERAAYLRKRANPYWINSEPLHDLAGSVHQLGQEIFLPESKDPLFARIEISPTFLGKMLAILYKPPQLHISMRLRDGRAMQYRTISDMMRTDFLITPLVTNTEEFALLAAGGASYLRNNEVKSIRLSSDDSRNLFWNPSFSLSLSENDLRKNTEHENSLLFGTMSDTPPTSLAPPSVVKCEGSIESLNGSAPQREPVTVAGAIYLNGWMGVAAKDGVVPDSVFVSLKSESGKTYYVRARSTRRQDVKQHFNQPGMADPGYRAMIDVSGLKGPYTLGLARTFKGTLGICEQFKLPLLISP
jgi:hypothetical protein